MRATAVVIVSSTTDAHVDLVRPRLRAAGVPVLSLATDRLGEDSAIHVRTRRGLPAVTVETPDGVVDGPSVAAVWWRRPAAPGALLEGLGDEPREFAEREWNAFIYGSLRLLDCRWVSHPDAIRAASFKLVQLQAAAKLGFAIPESYVGASPAEVTSFLSRGVPVVGKLVAGSPPQARRSAVPYAVYTSRLDPRDPVDPRAVALAPAIYQEELVDKRADVRVTVVGTSVLAAAIEATGDPSAPPDWRRREDAATGHRATELPADVAARCLALTAHFGLRFAAIDLVRRRDGGYVFLELNPNGQWGWLEQAAGLPIADALCRELAGGIP